MIRIAVILGSTRPGRRGEQVAHWVMDEAAEHLRLIAGELQMADVRTNVALSLFTDFENFTELVPGPHQAQTLDTLLGEVIRWREALAPLPQIVRTAYPGAPDRRWTPGQTRSPLPAHETRRREDDRENVARLPPSPALVAGAGPER